MDRAQVMLLQVPQLGPRHDLQQIAVVRQRRQEAGAAAGDRRVGAVPHTRILADTLMLRGNPAWAPDGRSAAAAADGRPYPLPSVMLTRGAQRVVSFRDPQTLVILGGEIHHKSLLLLDLRTGAQRVFAQLPAGFDIRDFYLGPDGSEILFERVPEESDLALIDRTR